VSDDRPEDTGRPQGSGRPEDAGRPEDGGRPEAPRRGGRASRPPAARWCIGLGLGAAALGTLLNKALGLGGPGRVLVVAGAVLALAAVWRPGWFGRRGGDA
jgi:hypothetical protein